MRISEIAKRRRSDRNQSAHEKERAYRARFKPYLRAETEHDVPQPIFIAAMLGVRNLREVPLPASAWELPEDQRDKIVKAAIRDHHRRTQGRVPTFGRIIRYALIVAPGDGEDLAILFDIRGNRAGPIRTVPRIGEATLCVAGQRLSRSIWGQYGGDRD